MSPIPRALVFVCLPVLSGLANAMLMESGVVESSIDEPMESDVEYAEVDPARDGFAYPLSHLQYMYPFGHPDLPEISVLDDVLVSLSRVENGWIAPAEDAIVHVVRLADIQDTVIYGSALAAINQSVRDFMEQQYGLIGHLVTPDASEIAYQTDLRDLRDVDDRDLTILVWRAIVGDVRSVAHGERLQPVDENLNQSSDPESEVVSQVNRAEHQRLRDRFALKKGDLLTRKTIDDEIHRLNRHPGRRADAAITPTQQPGEVLVDMMITEPRPWNVYAQISNSGTESTNEWQERFGFIHRQLTGRDDVLELDYVTTEFDEMNAFLGSYTFDLGDRVRLKMFGRWNEYTARDVGLGFENFRGDGYSLGAEAAVELWQDGPRFIDVVAGARYEHIHVENRLFLIEGEEDFFIPYAGVRYQKRTPIHSAFAEAMVETNWGSVAGSSDQDVQALGRFGATSDFTRLKAQMQHSFFLEPIFTPTRFRGDKGPEGMTLAHEVSIRLRGQYSFNSRLVPNFEFINGGGASVRGYPESSTVGDDGVMGSIEYRFHLGRSLPVSESTGTFFGKPFRTARMRPYGSADWDMIFKGFLDVGYVSQNDAPFFEQSETLVGVGVGIETRLKQNVTLKLDYGMAMTAVGEGANRTVDVGDSRLHFVAQLVF